MLRLGSSYCRSAATRCFSPFSSAQQQQLQLIRSASVAVGGNVSGAMEMEGKKEEKLPRRFSTEAAANAANPSFSATASTDKASSEQLLVPSASDPAASRISLLSRHLTSSSSTSSFSFPTPQLQQQQQQRRLSSTMSSQPEHPTLLIPGPIEFDDAVLQSMSHYRY